MRPNEEGVPAGHDSGGVRPNPTGTEDAKVAATIGNWKRKLLDVSKRNRALNFKPTKVSTVTIVGEQSAEVFRHLYLQDRQMRFRPAPPKAEAAPEPTAPALPYDQSEEDAEEFAPSPDFVPYDAAGLALCKIHHWAFDSGLLSLDDRYKLLVSGAFDETGPAALLLSNLKENPILLPPQKPFHPALHAVRWHRAHRFQS